MTREELIKQCRYYKGEKECPEVFTGVLRMYWDFERIYVDCGGVFEGERAYYERFGGKKFPGIPYPLVIIMFTSWAKWTYDIKKEMPQFYDVVDDYLSIPDDHYPKDKIPGT